LAQFPLALSWSPRNNRKGEPHGHNQPPLPCLRWPAWRGRWLFSISFVESGLTFITVVALTARFIDLLADLP